MARIILLLVLLPWRLLAQPGLADGLPAGLHRPDSLRAWQPRPLTADTVALKRLINRSYQLMATNLDSARYLAQAAVALAWRRHQGKALVYGLSTLASAQYYAAQYPAAQRNYELLLWAARRTGRTERIGDAYTGLGLVAMALENSAGAEQYFRRAQQTYATARPRNRSGELITMLNRAHNYLNLDSLGQARQLVGEAISQLPHVPKVIRPAKYWALLGLVQNEAGQYDSAAATYRHTVRLARTTHDLVAEAEALVGLAELALRRADYRTALREAVQAKQLFHQLGDDQEGNALRNQAEALTSLRRPEAPATLRRYLAFRDSLEMAQRLDEVVAAQARFDLVEQQARMRELEQQRRISQLRAEQQAGRARQYALVAGSLLLLLLGGGALLGLLLRSRRRLQASEAALRQAHGTQQELMRIIGHDLRGPVALFQQMTPLLREAVTPAASADADELVGELDASAQHLGALVDNLLDWARLQGNLVRYAPVRLRAAAAVQGVTQLYEPVARRKGVALTTAVDDALLVWADLDLLATVLRNLLGNAIKYTPPGNAVRVAAEGGAAGVVFSVTDAGQGMSAEALAAVLRAERVVSARGTAGEPGTGLGLGLCQRFVALMGGELHGAINADGPGMRFWFVLPVFVG